MDTRSDRLILHPIDPAEARRIVDGRPHATDAWHPEYPFTDELVPLRALAGAAHADPVFTLYMIRTADDGLAVGGIGFFGTPGEDGSVGIGYGLVPAARGRGIATEALGTMKGIALRHGAGALIADTDLSNSASQRVLVKAGFLETHRDDTLIYYRAALDDAPGVITKS